MPDGLEARVDIDYKLKAALRRRLNDLTYEDLVEQLRNKGHKITKKTLLNIRDAGKSGHCRTVTYRLNEKLVGKKPKKIYWRESNDLARKIARLYCPLFGVRKQELSRQIVEEAKQQGLEYTLDTIRLVLFYEGRTSKIDPIITDILVKKFKKEAEDIHQFSLDEIEEFVNSFGPVPPELLKPYRVSWDEARLVIYDLQRLTGRSFTAIVGGITRKRLEERKLSPKKYHELQKERQQLLQYRRELVQLLGNAKDVLQNTESGNIRVEHIKYTPANLVLSEKELQLINIGQQNYGEKAFMENIFRVYIDYIKQKRGFPLECLKIIVNFHDTINYSTVKNWKNIEEDEAKPIITELIGKKLQDFAKDNNQKRLDSVATQEMLIGAMRDFSSYRKPPIQQYR